MAGCGLKAYLITQHIDLAFSPLQPNMAGGGRSPLVRGSYPHSACVALQYLLQIAWTSIIG